MTASTPEPSHGEIQELLGVFALDAVDPDVAAMVERHLEGCPKCSTEVAQHHEVAGLLANSGGASPTALWDGIASQLDGSTPPSWESLSARLETGSDRTDLMSGHATADPHGPEGSKVVPLAPDRRSRWVTWTVGVAAAAAAIVAVVLGVRVHHLDQQVNALQAPLPSAVRTALTAPSTKQVQLEPPAGSSGATSVRVTVVLTRSGTGFVQAQALSRLPVDQTYQLWGEVGRKLISLGLLGPHPTVLAFSVAGSTPVTAFAITDEHSGGVAQSNNQPVVSGQVNA